MLDSAQGTEFDEPEICQLPEISQLKEWLSSVSGEYRAYLKGASKALLYVQEIQDQTLDYDSLDLKIKEVIDY